MIMIEVGGVAVPALGLGTWPMKGEECAAAVASALRLGYRHVDTATFYQNEDAVGEGLRRSGLPRDQVFVTTKVWHTDLDRTALAASAEASLRRLGTDHVDLLLIHWPSEAVPLAESLGALLAVKRAGKARLVGVSNFPRRYLRQAIAQLGPDLACLQVEYHPRLDQAPLLQAIRAHGGFLTAYSPLLHGKLSNHPVLGAIAASHGRTVAQVVLRWLVQQDRVAAIPKAASAARQAENLAIFDFALSADEMARIHGLADGHRAVGAPWPLDWDAV